MKRSISILLVNPWIFDFAAYNLWIEPLGLEYIASILQKAGINVNGIDCLNSQFKKNPREKVNGCSKFNRTIIPKPKNLDFVKRHFAMYGITPDEFQFRLKEIEIPDVILITSIMTYWYPGLFFTIKLLKDFYNGRIPIILGGIYASLCKTHALTFSDADIVYSERNILQLFNIIENITGKTINKSNITENFYSWPLPDHTIFRGKSKNFFAILTQRGCPFKCSYCASPLLNKSIEKRDINSVIDEIIRYSNLLNTKNIAFYDDALLLNSKVHLIPTLKEIIKRDLNLNFHLPNAIHSRFITPEIAKIFFESGFKTIRIGLETSISRIQKATGNKVSNKDYLRSIEILKNAGYKKNEIGVYILVGLPDQNPIDVEETIKFVNRSGASPYLSFYSPIPHTPLFNKAMNISKLNLKDEPLFQNNSVYILKHPNFSEESIQYLKDMAKESRKQYVDTKS